MCRNIKTLFNFEPPATEVADALGIALTLGLTSSQRTPMELRTFADWTLRPRLLAVPGVAKVDIFGGEVLKFIGDGVLAMDYVEGLSHGSANSAGSTGDEDGAPVELGTVEVERAHGADAATQAERHFTR